ncbi:MAG: alanine--tRNA ligase [Candidatus Margulisiibacteriota bacterium]
MKSAEIREKFLKYFEGKGHKILPGASLIPTDPTVLLTLAGMLQFKPIFLGQEKPKYKRATTVQKCVRMVDIDNVGKTARHHTFFEMLGNFSFGDYFKKEAIQYAWELLVNEYKLFVDKLLVAVYEKDDEAFDIWNKSIGLPSEKICRLGEDNNFWAVGPTGPCGPCSEIYYDFGPEKGCGKPDCKPGCDCDRYLEVWNLVFIQYDRNEKGELIPLKKKGIDTGMGLERIASILQGVDSNFETDLFVPIIDKIKGYTKQPSPSQRSLNIIADHVRAVTHLISDGVVPDNTGRGYVLRRLIRRAVRHGKLLGIEEPFLYLLSQEVVALMKYAYPVLSQKDKIISRIINAEEENFLSTLEQGMELFREVMEKHKQDKVIPGETVFKLHDTYGFPIELSREIAGEQGFKLDEKGFEKEMEKQRERAREAGIPAEKKKLEALDLDRFGATKFTGYEKTSEDTKILAIFPKEKFVILEKTPFYGGSGGQVGDTGIITSDSKEVRVVDALITQKGTIVHEVDDTDGLKEKMKVKATIDISKRSATQIHHTATHLLHKALREVLGEHVKQSGSYVGPDKLRFDFSHFAAMGHAEIEKVEAIVNQKIKEKLKVETLQKSYKDALKMGAIALFGEKYGEKVRVLKIGDYSLELCGGTHLKSTSEILFFKIVSESALGAGIRRIEAVGGQAAKLHVIYKAKSLRDEASELIRKYRVLQIEKGKLGGETFTETRIFEIEITELESLTNAVDNQDSVNVRKFLEHLEGRVDWLKERFVKAEKEIRELKLKSVIKEASGYVSEMAALGELKVLVREFKEYNMEMLRAISDTVQKESKSCIMVLASSFPGRLIFLVTVTQDLVNKGNSAKKIAEAFTAVVGGKGGGRENKVEGGGKDPTRIIEAFDKVLEMLGK